MHNTKHCQQPDGYPAQDVGSHNGYRIPNVDLRRSAQTLAVDQEPLDLDLDAEVTEDGQNKEELREWIVERYRRGTYTGALCFELYDRYELWPAKKAEFWSIFVEGIMACRSKYDPPPSAPVTSHKSIVSLGNAQDMTHYSLPDFGFAKPDFASGQNLKPADRRIA